MENRCCCGCHQTLLHLEDEPVFTDEPQSRVDGWMDGNIYSQADVADKYGNQTRWVVFVKDHNIFGFLFFFLKKNTHILEGKKKHVRIREIKGAEGKGGGWNDSIWVRDLPTDMQNPLLPWTACSCFYFARSMLTKQFACLNRTLASYMHNNKAVSSQRLVSPPLTYVLLLSLWESRRRMLARVKVTLKLWLAGV